MKRERKMKRAGSVLSSLALALVVVVSGGMLAGGAAQAAQQTQTSTTTQTDTTTTTTTSSTVDSTLSIPVSGTVTTTSGTSIAFSGNVKVNGSAVTNVVGIAPFVMLTFDCSGVTATSGTGASLKTYDTTGFQVIKIRALQPSDSITMTVPVNQLGAGATLASAWQVTANLTFNAAGQLTSGTLSAATAPTADPATAAPATTTAQ